MGMTTAEARALILEDLGTAINNTAIAVACLGEAFEQLDVESADRLEAELFRPTQKAYATAQRTHFGFADRFGLPKGEFELPPAGVASQGVKAFIERAVAASEAADSKIAGLQDSMLPIEAGDAELRSGLGDARELLKVIPGNAHGFLRVLGR